MKNKLIYILIGFILFVVFIFFSFFVHQDFFVQFDFDTTVKLQDKIPRRFDTPFSTLSLIGSFEIASVFLLLILILFKKLKGIFVLFIFAFFHVIEIIGKYFIDHPGPPFMFVRYDIPFSFPSSYVHPGSAYPSGHSGRTIFISIILSFLIYKLKINKNVKLLLYIVIFSFDILMLVSRVYLAEHWSTDVIGGALLAASLALVSLIFL